MADQTLQDIEQQIALCRQRFQQTVEQIRTVLATDLAGFPAREAKRAFLAHPAAADALSDARVAELKAAATALGRDASARIAAALADTGPWGAHAGPPDDPRKLDSAQEVWAHVRTIDDEVAELLAGFGLLAEGDAPRYRAPAYFVQGLYLPTLAEHYWKLLAELADLEGQKERAAGDRVRERLEARWRDA